MCTHLKSQIGHSGCSFHPWGIDLSHEPYWSRWQGLGLGEVRWEENPGSWSVQHCHGHDSALVIFHADGSHPATAMCRTHGDGAGGPVGTLGWASIARSAGGGWTVGWYCRWLGVILQQLLDGSAPSDRTLPALSTEYPKEWPNCCWPRTVAETKSEGTEVAKSWPTLEMSTCSVKSCDSTCQWSYTCNCSQLGGPRLGVDRKIWLIVQVETSEHFSSKTDCWFDDFWTMKPTWNLSVKIVYFDMFHVCAVSLDYGLETKNEGMQEVTWNPEDMHWTATDTTSATFLTQETQSCFTNWNFIMCHELHPTCSKH